MGDRSISIGGNNIGGVNVPGDNANITVNNKNIGALPAEESDKEKLEKLLEQLNAMLKAVPEENKAEAEKVAVYADNLIKEAGSEKPQTPMLELTKTGMIDAAKMLAGVAPHAVTVVKSIAELVMG